MVSYSREPAVIKLPVKRAPWFSVYNWQVASCEYKQYCDVVLPVFTEKGSQFDENMKEYNEDDVDYWVMCRLRQHLVKLGKLCNEGDVGSIERKQLDLCIGKIMQ